jgi:hypothetical protein
MRYLIVHQSADYYSKENPPPEGFMQAMDGFLAEANRSGVLLAGEGLKHPDTGTKIVVSQGKTTTTDGPYAEAKEVVAGFVMLDVKSHEEAVVWGHRFAECFDEVEVEVRPIVERSDF